ncbi:MAG: cation transporter [Lachnospiraceae bacterium]|nr:cation transporter [Lachnospiraceae bacterium]
MILSNNLILLAAYLVVAAGVTFLSIKAADYVDWIDKKTSLSGAFIGGIMLSAVTSLPELFTSLSSTLMLDQPGLCIGNILGSDLFNIMVIALLILVFYKGFSQAHIADSHRVVLVMVLVSYLAIALNMWGILTFEVLTISVTSVLIIAGYIISVRHLSDENGAADESEDDVPLTLKQIIIRFVIVSIGIIALSILISYVTDAISDRFSLGKGIAGALFMGVATSLPEVASSIALFRKKNYDIAVGNIIGSNIFNLAILGVVDIIYVGGSVYDFTDPKTVNLMYTGIVSTVLMYLALKVKNKAVRVLSLVGIVASYVLFLYL